MLKIGLTGGIASGKTTVSHLFAQHGVPIIDADLLARELVRLGSPALTEIIAQFGSVILSIDGTLNRPTLRYLIFNEPQAKQQLENILYPKIRMLLQQRSRALFTPYCILVIPLLIEAKMTDLVDQVLVIETDIANQRQRLQQRDNIDAPLIESMIKSQLNSQQRHKFADNIIENNGNSTQLRNTVNTLHQYYLKQAKLHSLDNSSTLFINS